MAWLTKDPDAVYTDLEDGGIVLHLGTKLYYSLNTTGQAIWRLLDSVGGLPELIRALTAEYEVEPGRLRSSVARFLRELDRERLLLPGQVTPEDPADAAGDGADHLRTPPPARKPFPEPELLKHAEPLHDVVMNPFDPQLPLAE
jgi:hypothetical protein